VTGASIGGDAIADADAHIHAGLHRADGARPECAHQGRVTVGRCRWHHGVARLTCLVYAYGGVKADVRHDDPKHAEDAAWQQ
jgi:hypothetical protein